MFTKSFLSRQENRVLGLLCAGRKPKRIARRMGIAVNTVRVHIANLRLKFTADSMRQLVERARLSEETLLRDREKQKRRWTTAEG
jgi:DNA-binding CsgD family transcriptional regulator